VAGASSSSSSRGAGGAAGLERSREPTRVVVAAAGSRRSHSERRRRGAALAGVGGARRSRGQWRALVTLVLGAILVSLPAIAGPDLRNDSCEHLLALEVAARKEAGESGGALAGGDGAAGSGAPSNLADAAIGLGAVLLEVGGRSLARAACVRGVGTRRPPLCTASGKASCRRGSARRAAARGGAPHAHGVFSFCSSR
jgi:hypothetical protein